MNLGAALETKITVKNGNLSDDIQSTIKQKVSKLPKFFDRTTGIQVLADLQHSEPEVEIILSAEESHDFFASDSGGNVLTAVEGAIHKIESQLKKHKEKLKGHR